ncbi:hypothetical protein PROFUN_12571 [Planoprotostelium fungivorum]|uniref:Alanine--tRNA ligase n=1 Tax=Planoprotostelium fungivorum TaxID=1890364 RepID=A0A2P6N6V7_9EUKA|nr:hypothetical protein PROFUN_12571 [Planoprotostelium fungivorum]
MSEWTVQKVRQTFIDFFKSKEHEFVPSSPAVPVNDKTLLFANSGMNQFKPIFQGTVDPTNPLSKLKRAANSQKCIRAGGKHNDLDDVGKDTYHHTFFEMLGNWSFGDYFKQEAIDWAWELLTKVYGLPTDRLYVTYFEGDDRFGLKPDEEARQMWLKYLPTERVLPFGMKENFWEMGETGPCGPCSEIHFDRIGGRDAAHLVNRDDPLVIEIWNLVFMQFNREPDRSLRTLPAKHVDTGMGLERLVSILQNVNSNYDTDIFTPYFETIRQATGAPQYAGKVGKAEDPQSIDMAYRVVADHIRTLCFAIADGAVPSNEKRGFVLRRILRRGVRYGSDNLGGGVGFFSKLVPRVVELMEDFYPELRSQIDTISSIVQDEEKSFEKTLKKGKEHLEKAMAASKDTMIIRGSDAFTLADTHGYPIDLTQLIAEENGYTVDVKEYAVLVEEAKKKSREARQKESDMMKLDVNATAQLGRENTPTTRDEYKHEVKPVQAKILAIWNGSEFVQEVSEQDKYHGIVLDVTNFYAEQGGQIYDTGVLTNSAGFTFEVENVQTYAGYVLHIGQLSNGTIRKGETVTAKIDEGARHKIMSNHTSTHILNHALREVLGDGIDQKGSLVDSEKLRFDFSHGKPLTTEELKKIEELADADIKAKYGVYRLSVPLAQAQSIFSVRAVFGETYPDPVTVVSIGKPVEDLISNPSNPEWRRFSIEFCGGTHIKDSSLARDFVIISETMISKGVRRVVAWTGEEAKGAVQAGQDFRSRLEAARKKEDDKEVSQLSVELEGLSIPAVDKRELRKTVEEIIKASNKQQKNVVEDAKNKAEELVKKALEEKKNLIVEDLDVATDKKAIAAAQKVVREKFADGAAAFFSKDNKSTLVSVDVGASLLTKLTADAWVKEIAKSMDAKGGGKQATAQASGNDVSKLEAGMQTARAYAAEKLQ